jgi:hypothetical protein
MTLEEATAELGRLRAHLLTRESSARGKRLIEAIEVVLREIEQLRAALEHIVEYWNRAENDRAMNDALYHMLDTAEEALGEAAEAEQNGG